MARKRGPLGERCWSVFDHPVGHRCCRPYNNHSQIVQTDDAVMILAEMNRDARIIRLKDSQHNEMHKWLGDSIGYYDGDSLVAKRPTSRTGRFPRFSRHFFICLRMPELLKDFPALIKTHCSIDSQSMILQSIPDPER